MKIIQVLHSHGYGGAECHALVLMQGLMDRGHEVLFAGPADSWLWERCQQHGIEARRLNMVGMYDLLSYARLRYLAHDWRADIVHGQLLRGARYAGAAAGDAMSSVCTAHSTTANKHMGRCKHIIAVSEAVRSNLLQVGYSDNKISVIHNGVPDTPNGERNSLRSELGITPGTFALFNAGRFIRDKGQDLLVTAVRRLPSITLYLAGDASTSFGKEVRSLAKGVSNIHFLGFRDECVDCPPRSLRTFTRRGIRRRLARYCHSRW